MSQHTNELAEATSPYLLQHAHNPVNWVEWSEQAFETAKKEGKLVLISIGYSACHWCHVMERESFENEDVAKIMNEHFVCIKVDREERPDVDQVYMNAVQLMTQKGGWPLNCFTLSDGRPIYGGTYFQVEQWVQILKNLWSTFIEEPEKVEQYATKLSEGVNLSEMIEVNDLKASFETSQLAGLVAKWKKKFDFDYGGETRAPKFPLPNNYEFLLHYGYLNNDKTLENHVHRTLQKMARGGIYDQIGGGFSRYSVDTAWKVPHFEKMLYDNAQLLSLYGAAYSHNPCNEYKQVLLQTVEWLRKDMFDRSSGGYYSALDADSEGIEGKYYIWTEEELKQVLDDDFTFAKEYFNINEAGYWENDQYILLRKYSDVEIAKKLNIECDAIYAKVQKVKEKLLSKREERLNPGLDNKKITSWNALLAKGFIETGCSIDEPRIVQYGKELLDWILTQMWDNETGHLYRVSRSKTNIRGFLDDYANTIDALIKAYEKSFEIKWLNWAKILTAKSIELFSNEDSGFFYYTESNTELIARKMEVNDNVIPSSNSVMAKNLFKLGVLFEKQSFNKRAKQMLSNIYDSMSEYGSGYSNWAQLALYYNHDFKELAIVGNNAKKYLQKLNKEYLPNVLVAGGSEGNIPFLLNRKKELTHFYVCQNQQCNAPLKNFEQALAQIKRA